MDSLELAIAAAIARDSLPERECTRCGEIKSPAEFPPHPRTRSGLDSWCRACYREAKARVRARNKMRNASADPYSDPSPKACLDCSRKLSRSEFPRDATKADGLNSTCRACNSRRNAAWVRENPDKHRAKERKRRALKHRAYHVPYDEATILAGNGGLCRYCDAAPATEIDHFIPIAWSGDDAPWNLIGACKPCNSSKNDRDPYEWMASRGVDLDAWEARHIAGWFELPEELWESVRSHRPPAEEV